MAPVRFILLADRHQAKLNSAGVYDIVRQTIEMKTLLRSTATACLFAPREVAAQLTGRCAADSYFLTHLPDSSCTQTPGRLVAAICLARAFPTESGVAPVSLAMMA